MAGRPTEKPFKMLLGVISATNMPISSLGCFCIMYLSQKAMMDGPQQSSNHVSFRSKLKYPNNQSQLVWNEQFLVGVRDPRVDILSVCVKSQHMMHTPTVAACAIELKLLKLDELVDQNVTLYMRQKRAGQIRLRIQLAHNEKYVGVARPVAASARRTIPSSNAAQKAKMHQQEQALLQQKQKQRAMEEQEVRQKQLAMDQELEYQRTLQIEREARMIMEQRLARQSALQQEREKRMALELELERLRNVNHAGTSRVSIESQPQCDNQIADLVGAFANANMASQVPKPDNLEDKLPAAVAARNFDPVLAVPVGKPPSYAQIFPTCDRVSSRSISSCASQSELASVDLLSHNDLPSSDSSDSSRERRRRKERKKRKKAEMLMRLMEKEKKRLRRKAGLDEKSDNNSTLDSLSSDSSSSSSSTSSGERRRRKLKKKYKERASSTTSNSSGRRRYTEEPDQSCSMATEYQASSKIYEDYCSQDNQLQEAPQPTRLYSIPPSRIPKSQTSSMFSNISLSDVGKVAAGAAALYNVSCGGDASGAVGLIPIGRAIGKMLSGSAHHHHAIENDTSQVDDSSAYDAVDTGNDWASYGGDY